MPTGANLSVHFILKFQVFFSIRVFGFLQSINIHENLNSLDKATEAAVPSAATYLQS